uniref:NADH dehydrogenase subunit 4L n=1 Tax=Phyllosticta yuccae TaxID=1151444 RepID=UPI0027A95F37|nr:NADH dehydrogenase subunit 4L [Phyllosticta yuccae]WGC90059.1 NADH dehydrogenase subunit 4L [Phyllosticta yuccae]
MNLSTILFLIGIFGFVLNRKNIILMLISIEIMLLAITFLMLLSSLSFDDILGQTYAIYVIAVAGAESAIGLGILVAFYRLRFSLVSVCLSYGLNSRINRKIKKLISYFGMAIYTTNQPSRSLSIGSWSRGKGLPLCPRRFKTSVAGSSIGEQKGGSLIQGLP